MAFRLAPCACAQVSFPDYVPLTPAKHGVKTFEWTYDNVGQFTSQLGATQTIHYGDGTTLAGTEITNFGGWEAGVLVCNDGTAVKILGSAEYYFSTDSKLTSHPAAWSFGSVTEGLVVDQRPYYVVKSDRTSWLQESDQLLLFDIQDVTVPAGTFTALRFDIDIDDVGQCRYTTRLWFVKNLGLVRIHRVNPSPDDCLGCLFTCRCDDNLELVNTPAELVSALVDGRRY